MQQVAALDPSRVQELVDTTAFLHDAGELAPAAYHFFSAFGARLLAAQAGAVFGADEPRDWLAAASALNEGEEVAAAQLALVTLASAPAVPAAPVAPAAPAAPVAPVAPAASVAPAVPAASVS